MGLLHKLLKERQMYVGFMDVILLHSVQQHVSASHVAFFRVLGTGKQNNFNVSNSIHSLKENIHLWLKSTVE
jgi:hypothetical protein